MYFRYVLTCILLRGCPILISFFSVCVFFCPLVKMGGGQGTIAPPPWIRACEITRFIIFQLYINLISVWTCILILDRPQIKEPFYCIHRINLYVGYYGLVIVRPQTFHHSQGNIKYPYWIASICYMNID